LLIAEAAMSEPSSHITFSVAASIPAGSSWHRVRIGWYRRQASPRLWVHVMREGWFWTIRASETGDEVDTSRAGGAYGSRRSAMAEADSLYPRQGDAR
jgi:hypothetical protein